MVLRVILVLSAVAHFAVLGLIAGAPGEPAARARPSEPTIRVLRGEVTTSGAEQGLRLFGYADVAPPAPAPAAH